LEQFNRHFFRLSQNHEKLILASSFLSVRPFIRPSAWNNSVPTGRIFIKFCLRIFRIPTKKIQISLYMTRITGTLHKDKHIFLFIRSSSLLRIRKFSDIFVAKIKTHISCSLIFFRKSCLYEIIWRNTVEPHSHRWQWRRRIACCRTKATNTHS